MTIPVTIPKKLDKYDFPDKETIPDGYYIKQIPKASTDNFKILLESHNKLIDLLHTICTHCNIPIVTETD
jgi:hypothetical protein